MAHGERADSEKQTAIIGYKLHRIDSPQSRTDGGMVSTHRRRRRRHRETGLSDTGGPREDLFPTRFRLVVSIVVCRLGVQLCLSFCVSCLWLDTGWDGAIDPIVL